MGVSKETGNIEPADSPGLARAEPMGRERLTIIRPDSRLGDSAVTSLRHLVHELIAFRSHIATIYRRDIQQTYHGSASAVFWLIALPLIPVAVFVALAALSVVPSMDGIPPTAYVSFSVPLWFLFVGCVQQPISVVQSRNQEAMKTALPLSVSIAASFARLFIETAIRLALCVLIVLITLTPPSLFAPAALVVIGIAALSFFGLGLLLSILNIIYPDVQRVTGVMLQYGIFLSGVIFPLTAFGPFAILDVINPFAVFIGAARDIFFHGVPAHPLALAIMSVLGLWIFILGCRQFYLMEYRIRGIE